MKNHLNELNRRREISRRIRLVKARMRDMPVELSFAEGRLAKLPRHLSMPPDWALASARLAAEAIMKPLAHLQPSEGRKYVPGDLFEILGVMEAIVSFVHYPTAEEREMTREVPEIEELKKPLFKQTEKMVVKFFGSLKRRKGAAQIPTWEEYVEYRKRRQKGLDEFATPEGDLAGLESIRSQLYYVIWMFWPDLIGKFTAPEIHGWFRRQLGESTSDKTVETVVTRIRKEAKKLRATLFHSAPQ